MRRKEIPNRGDVWMVDLGMIAKVRPCLLLTDFPDDDELALFSILAHTTSLRGNKWELEIKKHFLKKGAFHLQQIHSIPISSLVRKLGSLSTDEMSQIEVRLQDRLKLI